jgi:hypothetical protein
MRGIGHEEIFREPLCNIENAFQFSDFARYAEIKIFQLLGNLFLTGMSGWHF